MFLDAGELHRIGGFIRDGGLDRARDGRRKAEREDRRHPGAARAVDTAPVDLDRLRNE